MGWECLFRLPFDWVVLRRDDCAHANNLMPTAGLPPIPTTRNPSYQRNLPGEWARDGIRVNCVAPWVTKTPMIANQDPRVMLKARAQTSPSSLHTKRKTLNACVMKEEPLCNACIAAVELCHNHRPIPPRPRRNSSATAQRLLRISLQAISP